MEASCDENLLFVNLIEELKDILEKSQVPSAKKKKENAVALFIEIWKNLSGKQLTQPALLKKITNLKVRAKSALNRTGKLNSWQSKLLEITMEESIEQSVPANGPESDSSPTTDIEITEDDNIEELHGIPVSEQESSGYAVNDDVEAVGNGKDFMNQFETEQTRNLSNEQLQRIVLLEQIKVLGLQKTKLENEINNSDPIMFDISGLNVSSILKSNEQ